jgi:YD repeat-containing protein
MIENALEGPASFRSWNVIRSRRTGDSGFTRAAKMFEYFLDPAHAKGPKVTTKQLQSGSQYVVSWAFLDSLGRERQTQEISPASTQDAPKTVVTNTRYDDVGHAAATSLPVVADGQAGAELLAVQQDSVIETRHSYDAIGRETRTTHVAKGTELWAGTMAYFGDHTRITPPPGGVQTTSWIDARERLECKVEGTGGTTATTTFTYSPAGKLASITDPAGHNSTITYDLLGRRVEASDMDAGKSRIRYDANGNAIASWTYDTTPLGVGREATQTTHVQGKNYTQATAGYDPRGRVTGRAWTFPGGLGGLLADTTYRVNYGYDEADHETTMSYLDPMIDAPKETITTEYSALGDPVRLTGSITDPLTGHVSTRQQGRVRRTISSEPEQSFPDGVNIGTEDVSGGPCPPLVYGGTIQRSLGEGADVCAACDHDSASVAREIFCALGRPCGHWPGWQFRSPDPR